MTNSESLCPFQRLLLLDSSDIISSFRNIERPHRVAVSVRQITHPAQVNPALLKQAIRDVEPAQRLNAHKPP